MGGRQKLKIPASIAKAHSASARPFNNKYFNALDNFNARHGFVKGTPRLLLSPGPAWTKWGKRKTNRAMEWRIARAGWKKQQQQQQQQKNWRQRATVYGHHNLSATATADDSPDETATIKTIPVNARSFVPSQQKGLDIVAFSAAGVVVREMNRECGYLTYWIR